MSKKKDLTRIEDLSEFDHEDDPQTDHLLETSGLENLEDEVIEEEEQLFEEFPLDTDDEHLTTETAQNDDLATQSEISIEDDFTATNEEELDFEIENEINLPTEDEIGPSLEVNEESDLLENTVEGEPLSPDIENNEEHIHQEIQTQNEKSQSSVTSLIDVIKFAENLTYGKIQYGANPSYSLLLNEVEPQYKDDIFNILRDHELLTSDLKELYRQSLENNRLLISQLNEYSAIFLGHKMRRFAKDLKIGLAEEVQKAKSYVEDSLGPTTKVNLFQNKEYSKSFSEDFGPENIILATTPNIIGYKIVKYIEIATAHMNINKNDLITSEQEDLSSVVNTSTFYKHLSYELKNKAYQMGGNAVLSLTYQLTPLSGSDGTMQLTATGNIVLLDSDEN